MHYEIILSSDVPEHLLNQITKYWEYRHGRYIYKLEEIVLKNINIDDLITDIKRYSYCVFQVPTCSLCLSKFKVVIKDRNDTLKKLERSVPICDACKEHSPNYLSSLKQHSLSLESSINQLSEFELKILRGIVQLKSKMLIYKHVFNNDIENHDIWTAINDLQKKGLIWIEREDSWKIKSFGFRQELSRLID